MKATAEYAPDGSPIPLYARLPPMGEPELVHAAVPAGEEILELGAGAGRLTHPLLALGHAVVSVDEAPEMLALIRGADTSRARIASTALLSSWRAATCRRRLRHIGLPSLVAARDLRARGGGRVIAFEPMPDSAAKIRAAAETNALRLRYVGRRRRTRSPRHR